MFVIIMSLFIFTGYSSLNQSFSSSNDLPTYTIMKTIYTNLSKTESSQMTACISQIKNNLDEFQIMPSITIHEGESSSYPVIVKFCNQYYTLNGHLITRFDASNKHFVSSIKGQSTHFAQIVKKTSEFWTVSVKKLISRNKKIMVEEETVLNISKSFGTITSFSNSFSLSLKLFAFVTDRANLLFYRVDGRLDSSTSLKQNLEEEGKQIIPQNYKLLKINTQLAIYSTTVTTQSSLHLIHTNGKNFTLKKYRLPKLHSLQKHKIEIKFNQYNLNQFYLRIADRVYLYAISSTHTQDALKHSYALLTSNDEFFVGNSMLMVEALSKETNKTLRLYYNLSTGTPSKLRLPFLPCPKVTRMKSCAQSAGAQYICQFCDNAFECYSIASSADLNNLNSKSDYTDYSKFRIPLVLISIGFVIFISINKGKKKRSIQEQMEQQNFMKEIQKKDSQLYEQIKKSKRVNPSVSQNSQ